MAIIRDHLSDAFPLPLNRVFPASDLLAQYWMLATNRLHSDSSALTDAQDHLFSMSLDTIDSFHRFIQQTRSLAVAKNILDSKPPFAANPNSGSYLLLHLRKRADTVPVDIRADFCDTVREFSKLLAQNDGLILPPSTLTIAFAALYPTNSSSPPAEHGLRARALSSASTYRDVDLDYEHHVALMADPRQVRRDRRDDRRAPPPPVRQPERERRAPPPRPSSRFNADAPPGGSAKAQPSVARMEALISELQSDVAQLKNAAKKANDTALLAARREESPEPTYALHARSPGDHSSDNDDAEGYPRLRLK